MMLMQNLRDAQTKAGTPCLRLSVSHALPESLALSDDFVHGPVHRRIFTQRNDTPEARMRWMG